jgi:hypothetical protein
MCYEWFTGSFIVHINNVRMKKIVTAGVTANVAGQQSYHLSHHEGCNR